MRHVHFDWNSTVDRSGRFRVPKAKTTQSKNSFIPSAIQTFNQLVKRKWTFHLHLGCNFTTTICATVFTVCMCVCVHAYMCVCGWVWGRVVHAWGCGKVDKLIFFAPLLLHFKEYDCICFVITMLLLYLWFYQLIICDVFQLLCTYIVSSFIFV